MLVPMAKVELIGPKNRFFEVLTLLHEQGTLHIEDLSKKIRSGDMPLDRMEVVSDQAVERERMEDLLIRVRSIIKALHLPTTKVDEAERQKAYLELWKLDSSQLADEITRVIEQVEDRTSALASTQTSLESELSLLGRYEPILQKIQPLAKQIVTTGAFDSVALLVERRYKGALEQLKEELDKITNRQCEIVSTDVDEETTAAIVVFAKAYSEPVHKFLAMENVNQIRLPSDFQDMPFDIAYEHIRERRSNLPQELTEVRGELEQMSGKWYLKLTTIRDVLVDKIDEIVAIPMFGQTEYAFVVTGWLPVEDLPAFRKAIGAEFGNDVIVNQLEIDEHEFAETPVSLKNSSFSAPYQVMLPIGVGGLPKYGTVDPTTLLAVFYPLFFGMIVGDAGYGIVMLALVIWLRKKFADNQGMQLATSILGPATTMVIVFGIVYGEFFGNLLGPHGLDVIVPVHLGPLTLPFHRTSPAEIVPYIFLAVAVGLVQVSFGLVLGIINGLRTKHMKHVYEKGGLLAVIVGAMVIGSSMLFAGTIKNVMMGGGLAVILGGIVYAFKGGSILGAVESVLQFSNIASYIRIMAVGLSGAIMADAANGLVTQLGWFAGGVLGLILHSMNLLLAAFSPNIHALRLNFLEFFGKFYEAGKEQYKPFQKTGGEKSA